MRPFVVLAFGVAACGGGPICQRADRIFADCSDETDRSAEDRRADIEECAADLDEFCTAEDRAKYDAWLDCWRKSDLGCPTDITNTESEEYQTMLDCDAELEGRSETCIASGP
jgi:hypothetical protein